MNALAIEQRNAALRPQLEQQAALDKASWLKHDADEFIGDVLRPLMQDEAFCKALHALRYNPRPEAVAEVVARMIAREQKAIDDYVSCNWEVQDAMGNYL